MVSTSLVSTWYARALTQQHRADCLVVDYTGMEKPAAVKEGWLNMVSSQKLGQRLWWVAGSLSWSKAAELSVAPSSEGP